MRGKECKLIAGGASGMKDEGRGGKVPGAGLRECLPGRKRPLELCCHRMGEQSILTLPWEGRILVIPDSDLLPCPGSSQHPVSLALLGPSDNASCVLALFLPHGSL